MPISLQRDFAALTAFVACTLSALLIATPALAQEADVKKDTETVDIVADDDLPLEDLQTFTKVFGRIRAQYVDEVDDSTLLKNAIKGMLQGLDPHSAYLDKEMFDELQEHTSGEFGGLGMEVGMEDGFVKVIAPIDDTPAEKAGVMSGDLIIKLDDQAVKGLTLQESVAIMRGIPGSEIKLTIVRDGSAPFVLTLVRDVIAVKSVRSRMLEPNYGYLRISQFQANTGVGAARAIKKLQKKSPELRGLILDLRNNPGGVLQAAVDISDLFINSGTIVYTKGRGEEIQTRFTSSTPDQTDGLPLVVLVNGGSASASEIVAGALQDHRRALVVGTKTFGKGSVQSVLPLTETVGMKLTTALYFTPDGRSIQAQGIKPDIVVKPAKITKIEPNVLSFSEADLNRRLDNANDKNAKGKPDAADNSDETLAERDNQLYEALNMLKGMSLLRPEKSTEPAKPADNMAAVPRKQR